MSTLKLSAFTVKRGAGPVISEVDLELETGKVFALVGPNGAGKTSMLEAISGVIGHSSGDILIDDTSIAKLNRVQRSRAGIARIEQGRAIFPSLTVRENILLTAKIEAGGAGCARTVPRTAEAP